MSRVVAGVVLLLALVSCSVLGDDTKHNVLFIVIDDQRPEYGAYGSSIIKTPNVDAFAKSPGTLLFENSHTQQAICCPSRSSFLTGRRPSSTRVWDLVQYWRTTEGGGNFTSLPEMFRLNGYNTLGGGKVFHPCPHCNDDNPYSWTGPYFHASADSRRAYSNFTNCWDAVSEDVPDSALPDGEITDNAISQMRELASKDDPFFLAVGFHRPHLPWVCPKRFFDMYPEAPPPEYALPPKNWGDAKQWAWDPQSGPRHMQNLVKLFEEDNVTYPYGLVPESIGIDMRRAYYACTSFTDNNVGRVLDELDTLGLANSTIVVLIGDHGWQLAEHGEYGKKTNFETAIRAPTIMRVPPAIAPQPQLPAVSAGGVMAKASQLVEFVDIMPTLADFANIPVPPLCPDNAQDVDLCREGMSFAPLFASVSPAWKNASFSWYPPCMHDYGWANGCLNETSPRTMGYTMRTDRFRYTEWVKFNKTAVDNDKLPQWNELLAAELYDHSTDPLENANVVAEPEYASFIPALKQQLHAGWRSALPSPSSSD